MLTFYIIIPIQMVSTLQSILLEDEPTVLFDRKLTDSEAKLAAQNLFQSELYSDEEREDCYRYEEELYLKSLNDDLNAESYSLSDNQTDDE